MIRKKYDAKMKVIDAKLLDKVSAEAKESPRLRMNYNFHQSLEDKCHTNGSWLRVNGSWLKYKLNVNLNDDKNYSWRGVS